MDNNDTYIKFGDFDIKKFFDNFENSIKIQTIKYSKMEKEYIELIGERRRINHKIRKLKYEMERFRF